MGYKKPEIQFEQKFLELFKSNNKSEVFHYKDFEITDIFFPLASQGERNLTENIGLPISAIQFPLIGSKIKELKLNLFRNSNHKIYEEVAKYLEETKYLQKLSLNVPYICYVENGRYILL